jgi:hypothetical protein
MNGSGSMKIKATLSVWLTLAAVPLSLAAIAGADHISLHQGSACSDLLQRHVKGNGYPTGRDCRLARDDYELH